MTLIQFFFQKYQLLLWLPVKTFILRCCGCISIIWSSCSFIDLSLFRSLWIWFLYFWTLFVVWNWRWVLSFEFLSNKMFWLYKGSSGIIEFKNGLKPSYTNINGRSLRLAKFWYLPLFFCFFWCILFFFEVNHHFLVIWG